jgi:hypothetical protein
VSHSINLKPRPDRGAFFFLAAARGDLFPSARDWLIEQVPIVPIQTGRPPSNVLRKARRTTGAASSCSFRSGSGSALVEKW